MFFFTSFSFFTWRLKLFAGWSSRSCGFSCLVRAALVTLRLRESSTIKKTRDLLVPMRVSIISFEWREKIAALLIVRSVRRGRELSLFVNRSKASVPDSVLRCTGIYKTLCCLFLEFTAFMRNPQSANFTRTLTDLFYLLFYLFSQWWLNQNCQYWSLNYISWGSCKATWIRVLVDRPLWWG